jgi:hypothetical protein
MIAARSARHLDDMAALLNAEGVTAVQTRWINGRTVLAECASGDSLIRKVHAAMGDPIIELTWAYLINGQGLDMGDASTRAHVATTVNAGVWTADEGDQLLALAVQPVIVTRLDVEADLYTEALDGTERT